MFRLNILRPVLEASSGIATVGLAGFQWFVETGQPPPHPLLHPLDFLPRAKEFLIAGQGYRVHFDIAAAIAPKAEIKVVGIRPGEKLHEEMITDTVSLNTIDLGKYYAILPSVSMSYSEHDFTEHHRASKVPFGFKYNSGTNSEWETVETLKKLISIHVDSTFEVR